MFLFEWSKPNKNIDCTFKTSFLAQNQAHYTCCIENKSIDENYDLKFVGHHSDQKTNNDIIQIQFFNCNLKKIPGNLLEIFPNFKILHIASSRMRKINSYDLSKYQHLQGFVSINNELEYLPGDIFKNFDNLEQIIFRENNKFEFIEPTILNGLEKLNLVEFWDGQDYTMRKSGESLMEIGKNLDKKLFTRFENLKKLKNSIKDLEQKNQNLRSYNKMLLHDNNKLIISSLFEDSEFEEIRKNAKKLEIEVKQLKSNLSELKKENQQLNKSKTKSDHQIQRLKSSETALNLQANQLRSSNGTLKKENGHLKNSIENFRRQVQNSKSSEEILRTEIQQIKRSEEILIQKVEQLGLDITKSNLEAQKSKELQTKLTQNIQQLKSSESNLKTENLDLKNAKITSDQQILQHKTSQTSLNSQINQLKINNKLLKSEKQQLQKFKTEILNESTKDFLIQIDDRKFPVHKFLLAARSPILAEILKNNPEVENLNLVDISVEIFEIILKFLYTDELPGDDGTNFLHLFAAAGKMKIEKLVKFAAPKIINQVDSENAMEILRISSFFKLHDLKLKAFKLLKKKFSDTKFEDDWLDDPEKLIKVVTMLKKKEEALKKFDEEFKEVTEIK